MSIVPAQLFHGTERDFDRPRVGGYDGVFWTADASTVAQTYIPEAGSTVYTRRINNYEITDSVRPIQHDPFFEIAQRMGFEFKNIEWDHRGWSTSWGVGAKGFPKYAEVSKYIEDVLGYVSLDKNNKCYAIKCDGLNPDSSHKYVASDFKSPGFLLVVTGHEDLKLFDMGQGEGDLTDVQYNKLNVFQKLRDQGYDGVKIDDFCQTKRWGSVGHTSYGFFEPALRHLHIDRIAAQHFEWGESSRDLQQTRSPEYAHWESARKAIGFIQNHETEKSLSLRT